MRPDFVSSTNWKRALAAFAVALLLATAAAAQDYDQRDNQGGDQRTNQRNDQQYDQLGPDRDAYGGVPGMLTLPAGVSITGEAAQYLSSHENRPGDPFTMTLTQPIVVNGWVVARAGQIVHGEVTVANKGGRGKGPAQLGIELTELTLVDGQQLPITTQLIQATGGSNTGRDVGTVATTTVVGTIIGAAVDGGRGAGIGAAAGATAGLVGVLLSPGKPAVISPEGMLTFRLTGAVDIRTDGSERAFLPVAPQDYTAAASRPRPAPRQAPRRSVGPYPYPYPYPYYGYPYWGGPRITIVRPFGYRAPYRAPFHGPIRGRR